MDERTFPRPACAALVIAAAALPLPASAQTPPAGAASDDDRRVVVRLGEQVTQEDNLYRLPDGVDPALLLGPDASRDDSIRTTSLALLGRWTPAQQDVALDAALAANRFAENSDLDYTSGHAALDWNWRLGGKWSGLLEAREEQTLASFANTRSLEKDVFTTSGYRGELRFDVGPRWRAIAGARTATTEHEAEERRGDDADLTDASIGVEYHTPRLSSLAWEYKRSHAAYPSGVVVIPGGSASDYEDQRATVSIGYVASAEVALKASFGYVVRAYPYATRGDFSGDVWNAAVQWSPATKVQLAVEGWRDLKAYIDAESDHFVTTGEAVAVTWLPIDPIAVSFQVSREDQSYLGVIEDPLLPAREDRPTTAGVKVTYKLRDRALFNVSYHSETRQSNTFRFDYDAAEISVGAEVKF
jgi:hypothetical protein